MVTRIIFRSDISDKKIEICKCNALWTEEEESKVISIFKTILMPVRSPETVNIIIIELISKL